LIEMAVVCTQGVASHRRVAPRHVVLGAAASTVMRHWQANLSFIMGIFKKLLKAPATFEESRP